MAKKKLNLSTKEDKVYGEFTKGYRLSDNFIDRRGQKSYADTLDQYGRNYDRFMGETPTPASRKARQETMTPIARDTTRADSSPSDFDPFLNKGGSDTTPSNSFSQTRKVDAEEAVRKTHFERN